MARFALFAGCFSEDFQGVYEFDSEEQANEAAWQAACEDYDCYAGLHGIRSHADIREEDEVDEETAEEIYREECESQIQYRAVQITCDVDCDSCDDTDDCVLYGNI